MSTPIILGINIVILVVLGLVAKDEIKKRSEIGQRVLVLKKARLERNKCRRRKEFNLK